MNDQNHTQEEKHPINPFIDNAIRIGLIALLAAWCFYIASPFIGPILWGIIIAVGSYPLYRWMQKKLGLSSGWTATIFTLLVLFIIITPTVMLSNALVSEAQGLAQEMKDGTLVIPPPPESLASLPLLGDHLSRLWMQTSSDTKATLMEYQPQIKTASRWLFSAAGSASLGILILIFSIIIAGVFLAKAEWGYHASRLIFARILGGDGKKMTDLSSNTITSVVNGVLGIALIQTLLAGLGFLAMDIPGAGILALICLVMAVVQIDILIILIPLSIYMFSVTGTGAAIAFLVWNIAVGLMNNILKPILLSRGVDAPMAIIFIGAIGGLITHGIIGLFVGAVVLVLGYTLFVVWLKEDTKIIEEDIKQ